MRNHNEEDGSLLVDDLKFPEPNTTGEGELPMLSGAAMAAIRFALELKEMRQEKGLSIKEIASRANLDLATLSRLENGRIFNPRFDTLYRYAMALGQEIVPAFEPLDPAYLD